MAYASPYTGAQIDAYLAKARDMPDFKGEVANFAALPGSPTSGDIWYCIAAQGVYLVNRKPSGFYRYNGSAWVFAGDIAIVGTEVLDEDDMSSDSATNTATQQSIKAYSDSATQTLTNKTLTSPAVSSPTGIVTNDVTESTDKNYVTDADAVVIGNTSGTNTGDESAASTTVSGISELATVAEIDAGTDTGRTITPSGLAGSALQTTADGALQKDASNDADGVQMLERADHPNAPAATKGQLWVKNDSPNKPYFTDDAGTDFDLTEAATDNEVLIISISDETTDLTTGTAKTTFRMPYAMTLDEVRASVTTAPTGSVATFDINETGSTILSTKITIDAGEKTSETAATAPVISDSALADDAEITIDIDTIGSTVAGAGAKIYLIGTRT